MDGLLFPELIEGDIRHATNSICQEIHLERTLPEGETQEELETHTKILRVSIFQPGREIQIPITLPEKRTSTRMPETLYQEDEGQS